jgi:CRP/FNR family transcriptional regulator, cyclic AMP receptor protein
MDPDKVGNSFLHSHSLFGGLTDEELEEIRSCLKEERYSKGETILREGEPNSKLYFIVEGSVAILKNPREEDPTEQPVLLSRMHTGDTFGEMELIDIQPCAATVRAETDTTAVTFTNADLYHISKWNLKTYAMIIMNLAREISRRLRANNSLLSLELYGRQDGS